MVFSSLIFLFRFLPVFFIIYFAVPQKLKNLVLFLGSLIFYGWGEPVFLFVMLFSAVSDYVHGIWIAHFISKERKAFAKIILLSSISINLLLLGIFKYTGLFPLPIGISFYTFQTMSYVIDIYREEVKVQKNLLQFGVFVTMFPQLVAGPIVKYKTAEPDLKKRTVKESAIAYGISRFIVGLGKKVLLANNMGILWEYVYGLGQSERTVVLAWIGAFAYAFQIYFDFSGYSDMAIGLGSILGFHFPENFNYPYIAKNITDFWRRWHISLSSWFKEYVYIPLGGNRKGLGRQFFNIIVVWLLTGIWHGAGWNFLLWGAWFAFFLVMEKAGVSSILKRIPTVYSHLYTITIVSISWIFFASESLGDALKYIESMFGIGKTAFLDQNTMYQISNYYVILFAGALGATPIGKRLYKCMLKSKNGWEIGIETISLIVLLLFSAAFIVDASYNPFLYFRF